MSGRAPAAELVEVCVRSVCLGLNHGTTGNASARTPEGFLVTPTGFPLDRVEVDDLVGVGRDGRAAAGAGRVSSEWPLHRAVYREFPEAGAVLHAHPRFATTLACLRMGLPAVHYLLALAGADVRCSAYAAPGSEELAQAAVDALRERRACLLANHGLVAFGASPGDALALALEVETVAEYYWRGLQAGTPVALSEAEVEEVRARLGSYRTPPEAAE